MQLLRTFLIFCYVKQKLPHKTLVFVLDDIYNALYGSLFLSLIVFTLQFSYLFPECDVPASLLRM